MIPGNAGKKFSLVKVCKVDKKKKKGVILVSKVCVICKKPLLSTDDVGAIKHTHPVTVQDSNFKIPSEICTTMDGEYECVCKDCTPLIELRMF